jgi:uncharacterized membrane protein (UPF0182 family)
MRFGWLIVGALILGLVLVQGLAPLLLDIEWWRELGQLETFWKRFELQAMPPLLGSLVAFAVLWLSHAAGLRAGGLSDMKGYRRAVTLALAVASWVFASAIFDSDVMIAYFAGNGTGSPAGFRDYAFGQSLSFYIFELPFYQMGMTFVILLILLAAAVYGVTRFGWKVGGLFVRRDDVYTLDIRELPGEVATMTPVRVLAAIALALLGVRLLLSRFELVYADHGFLTGLDYVDDHVAGPLYFVRAGFCALAAVLLVSRQYRLMIGAALLAVLPAFVPSAVSIFVKPNEITLERPYIERHLAATREAYALGRQLKEQSAPITNRAVNVEDNRAAFENIRIWDWKAYHDAVTQIQTLRQYYAFADSDVDRYRINGQVKQVMISARELDINQLPDARRRWLNPNLIYTHGYGLVMSDATQIQPDGQPVNFIQDAPARVLETRGLTLTQPRIYYGERSHEPVFVNTAQEEFDYPEGDNNVHTRYAGSGGIPLTPWIRLLAAMRYFDRNILLTNYFTDKSRLMIRRNIESRLKALAGFVSWDDDPYPVLTSSGRMVWIFDGYTSTSRYPNAQRVNSRAMGRINYIRNSVKAVIDAYDGTTTLYVAEPTDPVIQAWQRLFPKLFQPLSAMPEDLVSHLRHPERMFAIQAEVYRTYHMKNPESFYNKEDVWDIANTVSGQETAEERFAPLYILATLPGSAQAEFLVMLPFTPRNKDNLIGLMFGRCDGERRGEIVVLELSKQSLVFGPMQMEARINQDQNISKDLTLWNQQGSRVLRGQMIPLPLKDSIAYVKPIYLQAAQARMPQLKKVALASGDQMIYEDTYAEALASLTRAAGGGRAVPASQAPAPDPAGGAIPVNGVLDRIRTRLESYRRLMSEGKYAEAGRELEAAEALARQR